MLCCVFKADFWHCIYYIYIYMFSCDFLLNDSPLTLKVLDERDFWLFCVFVTVCCCFLFLVGGDFSFFYIYIFLFHSFVSVAVLQCHY